MYNKKIKTSPVQNRI